MKYVWTMTHIELAKCERGKVLCFRATAKFQLGDNAYLNLSTGSVQRRKLRSSELVGRVVFMGQNISMADELINAERVLRTLYSGYGNPARIGENFYKDRIELV